MAHVEPLRVEVAYSARAGHMEIIALAVQPGATVADALDASGLLGRHALDKEQLRVGIWGRSCGLAAVVRERDRVEIYRSLLVDPKEARRQRFRKQGGKHAAKQGRVSGNQTP